GYRSTHEDRDGANLEPMEDAAFLRITRKCCRDRLWQEQLRPSNSRVMWRRQCSRTWLADLLLGEFVPVTGSASRGTAEASRLGLITFYSPYLVRERVR